eukprot:TRINITY_DN13114_c0_g1_i1.p1 TRINITY_DN13114_c0_g1~~TRINITY_DN13114_c0_g1_i1.p1  ORF type:complete len:466 (+),score=78.64 TRINITY_DN13114_c0_g1_i1:56-1453(+)
MSIVTVQLGQCGNQVGPAWFQHLDNELYGKGTKPRFSIRDTFFHEAENGERFARAVLIDMEQKVVQNTIHRQKQQRWKYDSTSAYCKQSGSANNWAFGYKMHGPQCHETICNITRREVEKCDSLGGFLVMQSLAGGTGSGVGTCITESLRDSFPKALMINQVVWPFFGGEVIVQNYNAVLSLSHTLEASDGVLVFQNDHLRRICMRLLNLKTPSFSDLNQVIASSLANAFLPAFKHVYQPPQKPLGTSPPRIERSSVRESYEPYQRLFYDPIDRLCGFPSLRLLTMKNIPQVSSAAVPYMSNSWKALVKHMTQMVICDAYMDEGLDWSYTVDDTPTSNVREVTKSSTFTPRRCKSLANYLVLRGLETQAADISSLRHPSLYSDLWGPNLSVYANNLTFGGYDRSACLLSNSQSITPALDMVLEGATRMYDSRAYLHHYHRYGLESDDICNAIAKLEQVLVDYRAL